MLNDSQKKKIRDVAIGHVVDSKLSIEDQIAAIRKQLVALSEALKVPLAPDFQALEDLVASEKAKKEEKATTKAKA
jgi:nitric oxide reductase activation protein